MTAQAFDITLAAVQLRGDQVSGHVGWASDWVEGFDRLVRLGLVEWRSVSDDQQEAYLTLKVPFYVARTAAGLGPDHYQPCDCFACECWAQGYR